MEEARHAGSDVHTAAHGGPLRSSYPHCSRGGSHTAAGGYALRKLQPMESPHWSRGRVRRKEWQRGTVMY